MYMYIKSLSVFLFIILLIRMNANCAKVNYVIATWSGKNTKRSATREKWESPTSEDTLKVHLKCLLKFKNHLSQITIMKPYCDPEMQYKKYYALDDLIAQFNIPILFEDCENFGYSNGQWMKCYETHTNQFDYYILVEDDYCPFTDNFDAYLIDYYNKKFPNGIGKLCGFVEGYPRHRDHIFPEHYESIVIVSQKTFQKVYDNPLWKGKPREALDINIDGTSRMANLKKAYSGAFYQINFSLLFTKIGIPLDDYCADYSVPYFQESPPHMYLLVKGNKSNTCAHKFVINDISDIKNGIYICVPVQLAAASFCAKDI